MSNPLSHVGQTPHPEVSEQVQKQCQQAQVQPQGSVVRQDQSQGDGGQASRTAPSEPPATRLPQHPQQQQDDPLQGPVAQQRIRQQGDTHAEDTALPAATDAD